MSARQEGWPFQAWQQIAIRRFNLAPSEFWAMPMGDWLGLLNGLKQAGFARKTLEQLLEIYPDEEGDNGHD